MLFTIDCFGQFLPKSMATFWLGVILSSALLVYSDQAVEHLQQLHCKPKQGCTLAKCDPMPDRWSLIGGINPPSHEYPILCQNEEDSSCCGKQLTAMEEKFEEMKSEFKRLELRLEMTEKREAEARLEITLLENEKSEIKEEVKNLKKESTAIKRAADENRNGFLNLQQSLLQQLDWHKAINGYFYKVFKQRVNYATAKQECVKQGARLATAGVRNSNTRGFLVNIVRNYGENTWIGLNDIVQEGRWVWEDGVVSNLKDADWFKAQPDNWRTGEDCAHYETDFGYQINDTPCSNNYYFLCEKIP